MLDRVYTPQIQAWKKKTISSSHPVKLLYINTHIDYVNYSTQPYSYDILSIKTRYQFSHGAHTNEERAHTIFYHKHKALLSHCLVFPGRDCLS